MAWAQARHTFAGRWFRGSERVVRGELAPQIVSADAVSATFGIEDAHTLLAKLQLHEFLITALTGANNDIAIIAREHGDSDVTLTLTDPPGNNVALSIAVVGEAITATLATDGSSAITTTAAQLVAALNASAAASALVEAALAPANSGVGVVTALASTPVAGPVGTTPTIDVSLSSSIDGTTWWVVGAFAQHAIVEAEYKAFAGLGVYGRWDLNMGADADERVAISLSLEQK